MPDHTWSVVYSLWHDSRELQINRQLTNDEAAMLKEAYVRIGIELDAFEKRKAA